MWECQGVTEPGLEPWRPYALWLPASYSPLSHKALPPTPTQLGTLMDRLIVRLDEGGACSPFCF